MADLQSYFEANFLDGEKLQKGQLISAQDAFAFMEQELEKQHERSRAMAYRDVATKAGSGNLVRQYAESRADQLEASLEAEEDFFDTELGKMADRSM